MALTYRGPEGVRYRVVPQQRLVAALVYSNVDSGDLAQRYDCCQDCGWFASSLRATVLHRVSCPVFSRTVLGPVAEEFDVLIGRVLAD